jgi:aspartyl-tRNA(Asn)/glutamyl-tRNA(Gln) amidotransferase subunit B
MSTRYETVIGLEVHAQLLTKSKMFCGCSSSYAGASPNTYVCPICLGMPGVLPVINRRAVEFTIMTALALNCEIPEASKFDRKNYPYPDLVKGYQISQYDLPFCKEGWIDVEVDGQVRRIGMERVHLEEDTARLVHGNDSEGHPASFADMNRSGVPLMEIVSKPDMRSPAEARAYLQKLRSIVRALGASTGNMDEGSFRCDANVSVRRPGAPLGTRCEIKNLNSFRFLEKAIVYEARRQVELIEDGGEVRQETRLFDPERGETRAMRSKEDAHDYRYFPDPDLLPMEITAAWIEEVKRSMPALPAALRRDYEQQGISAYDAALLTESRDKAGFFAELMKSGVHPRAAVNWMNGELSALLNDAGLDFARSPVNPTQLARLLQLVEDGTLSAKDAKDVLREVARDGGGIDELVERKGLRQITDAGALESAVGEVLAAQPKLVDDYRSGKEKAFNALVGQVMKATQGKANPAQVNEILKRLLATS